MALVPSTPGPSSYSLAIVLPERFPVPPVRGFCTAIEYWTDWFAPLARERARQLTLISVPHPTRTSGTYEGIQYRYITPGTVDLRLYPWLYRVRRKLGSASRYWQSKDYFKAYANKVARAVRECGANVVHLHNILQFAPVIRKACPQIKIVYDIKWHGLARTQSYFGYEPYEPALARACLEAVDHVVTPSRFMVEQTLENYPELEGRITFVPNGVQLDFFTPPELSREVRNRPVRALFAGRLTPEKGALELLEAFALARRGPEELELWIAGEFWNPQDQLDAFRAELREAITALGSRVRFLGWLGAEELRDAMRACDLFIHPVVWDEPFAMTTLEAMACGLPVVASRTGGTPEQIRSGREGILVAPGDSRALAREMEVLARDSTLRQAMGTAARERVERDFGWSRVCEDMHGIYTRLTRVQEGPVAV